MTGRPEDAAPDHVEQDLLDKISGLVDEEHGLRARRERGELDEATEHERLTAVEEQLDQLWDLLRRRRALRDAGQDPDAAQPQPVDEVESYQQ